LRVAGPTSEDIRTQIGLILASPAFQGSRRCRQFLEYVCEKSLAGELGSLKERAIAIEVFGRRPQSDFAEDTIVRVGAREVRKRLALYYGTAEGAAAKIRVDLPSGCYAPEFRYPERTAIEPAPLPLALVPTPEAAATPVPARRYGAAAIVAVLGIALLASYFTRAAPPPTTASFELFWGPVIAAREPLLLSVGHPLVYHPSKRALKLNDERLPVLPYPVQRPLQLAPGELTGSDIIPVLNQYVGFGDMVVATEVAAMLGRRSKETLVRMASTVPFADLRQSPTLLIGAITNRWTMELGQKWRFRFDRQERGNLIVDTAGSRVWAVPHREDGAAQEDYLLISRVPHSSIGKLLIVAAGIKQFGTEAAGHLLSEPVALDSILSKMPAGWADKNLQVVLKVQVIGNTPATPEIVAWHTW
jgi:hypothetical protein